VCQGTQNASGSHFCPTCQVDIQAKAPLILEIPEEHYVFQSGEINTHSSVLVEKITDFGAFSGKSVCEIMEIEQRFMS
jgi:hypothetical protein